MYGSPAKDLNLPPAFTPRKEEPDFFDGGGGGQRPPGGTMAGGGGGLLRYRSAPSTLLADVVSDNFLPPAARPPPASPESEAAVFARFFGPDLRDEKPPEMAASPELLYRADGDQIKNPGAVNGVLLRHSSSPAGLFDHLNVVDGGYGMSLMTSAGLKGQLSFSSRSRQGSLMSQISEMGSEELGGGSSPEDSHAAGGAATGRGYFPGYSMPPPPSSWDDSSSSLFGDGLSPGMKRNRDHHDKAADNSAPFVAQEAQMSIPKSSTDMAAIEKFLQFQDAVPCKIRAKRGCATHPRSIAERVRRTRISERIRKLQELVPNMDKQTNTADMLDLAVDYIKDLQKQVKALNDDRGNCTCGAAAKQRGPYTTT